MVYYGSIPKKFPILIFKSWLRTYASDLKAILKNKIPTAIETVTKFRKEYGQIRMGEITLEQMYNGMRGVKGLICETSVLDPQYGIQFRDIPLSYCITMLPKAPGSEQPLPEGVFWLLITGDMPNEDQVRFVSTEWAKRSKLPDETYEVLSILKHLHPLGQLSAAVISMTGGSKFRIAYKNNIHRDTYWEFVYEDTMDLLGRLISVAAVIYRNTYQKSDKAIVYPTIDNDWSSNFARMLGFDSPKFLDFLRLYLTIYADHDGGNVSAHTVHLVGSALSDPYLAYSAGINGLAGPAHGLASEDVVMWLQNLLLILGDNYTEKNLQEYVWKSITKGNVIPGFGHAILRRTDPRYIEMQKFAIKHMPDDKMCKLVIDLYRVVPPILLELGKVENPWANGVAYSGVLLQYYGMLELNYHTILMAVSRAMGVLAQLVWSRALSFPVERPKSFSTKHLMRELRATL